MGHGGGAHNSGPEDEAGVGTNNYEEVAKIEVVDEKVVDVEDVKEGKHGG